MYLLQDENQYTVLKDTCKHNKKNLDTGQTFTKDHLCWSLQQMKYYYNNKYTLGNRKVGQQESIKDLQRVCLTSFPW